MKIILIKPSLKILLVVFFMSSGSVVVNAERIYKSHDNAPIISDSKIEEEVISELSHDHPTSQDRFMDVRDYADTVKIVDPHVSQYCDHYVGEGMCLDTGACAVECTKHPTWTKCGCHTVTSGSQWSCQCGQP